MTYVPFLFLLSLGWVSFFPGEFLPNFDLKITILYSRLVERIIFHEEKKMTQIYQILKEKNKNKNFQITRVFMITSSK
jgi:hypothetical protein